MALSKINSDSVDLDGNVGIGGDPVATASNYDGAALHLRQANSSSAGSQIHLTTGASGHAAADGSFIAQWSDNDLYVTNQESAGEIKFSTGGSQKVALDSSGNLLVGQTTKRGKVTLSYNTNTVSDPTVYVANDGGSAALITFGDGGGSNTYGSITKGSGNTVSYTTSSDYRLKENLADITDGITRLKQLDPKRFNFIADEDDTTVDGFLAHEVQTVVPEAITGEKDAVDADGNPEYQGIDQAKLVPLLTAALQEAVSKIEALETANASMETRLTALEGA